MADTQAQKDAPEKDRSGPGRKPLPVIAQARRETWRYKAKQRDFDRTFPEPREKVRPVRGIERICREGIPGFDPWANPDGSKFHPALARRVIEFIQEELRHSKGEKAGRNFDLEVWQQAIFGNVYGWRRKDGTRRFREVFLYVPAKNGKTPMAAAFIMVELDCMDEPGAEIVGVASRYDQATLVFEHVRGFIYQNERLSNTYRIYGANPGAVSRAVQRQDDFSTYKVMAAKPEGLHGLNLSAGIIDEVHTLPDRHLYDTMKSRFSARRNPLLVSITTADFDREDSICNELHDYASGVRDGTIDDPSFLPVLYEATLEDDWSDSAVWRRANPNLGVSKSESAMKEACARAKANPSSLNSFLRVDLNIRTAQQTIWIPSDLWSEGATTFQESEYEGQACWCGLDLSAVEDLTAFVMLFRVSDDPLKVVAIPRFWCPEDTIKRRILDGAVYYQQWVKAGALLVTPGNMVDYAIVRKEIFDLRNRFAIQKIAIDQQFQGAETAGILIDEGFDVVSFPQTMGAYAAPTIEFERMIGSGRFLHGNHSVLTWMARNVSVRTDYEGRKKPDKKTSKGKIDGIVAAIMALGGLIENDGSDNYAITSL